MSLLRPNLSHLSQISVLFVMYQLVTLGQMLIGICPNLSHNRNYSHLRRKSLILYPVCAVQHKCIIMQCGEVLSLAMPGCAGWLWAAKHKRVLICWPEWEWLASDALAWPECESFARHDAHMSLIYNEC